MMTDESSVRLLDARVGRDSCLDRGYYITNRNGVWYLTHQGDWTNGIDHGSTRNWWGSERAAQKFLERQKEDAGMVTVSKCEKCGKYPLVRSTPAGSWLWCPHCFRCFGATQCTYVDIPEGCADDR